jgi:hypothetical protein
MTRPIISLLFFLALTLSAPAQTPRKTISLDGPWKFCQQGQRDWKTVQVPCSWETHEGMKFDGIGWYEKTIDPLTLAANKRLLLHFDAVATEATVWFDDVKVGSHLGGWTPFRFDVTEFVRKNPDKTHTIRVRVDEKVGHNTQGFLPIIAPHFGGMWQGVKLLVVSETYFDELRIHALGNPATHCLEIVAPVQGSHLGITDGVSLDWRLVGEEKWQEARFNAAPGVLKPGELIYVPAQDEPQREKRPTLKIAGGAIKIRVPLEKWQAWSPEKPTRYEVRLRARFHPDGSTFDIVTTHAGFRTIETKADQFLLNGQPLSIRGVLNWGYYPPLVCPDPNPERWRQDLKLIKSWGFNLMKCCLWIPPKHYLDIADEEGVLIWMEYPAWHPQFTKQFLPDLEREYTEFFQHDRNHPSVILRSLTCETGHGADLKVIQSLYDKAKAMVPGCLVVDDSSWIEWNRVYDFYDDHPYGNNHTWVATLARLKNYIQKKGVKPLILGEAIAADTWTNPDELLTKYGKDRPWWLPIHLDANKQWLDLMAKVIGGPVDQKRLTDDSLKYAWLMRKYQIETFRREVPNGGYVVSVLRDFRLASMGLLDYEGLPKDTLWPAWHKQTLLLLKTEDDRRTFSNGEEGNGELFLSQFGPDAPALRLLPLGVAYQDGPTPQVDLVGEELQLHATRGTLMPARRFTIRPRNASVPFPVALISSINGQPPFPWSLWLVPERKTPERLPAPHSSLSALPRNELFPGIGIRPTQHDLIVAQVLDDDLISFMEQGGKVLLLPNGQTNSLPLHAHWFLRGGPFVNTYHPLIKNTKYLHELLVETQHFDLAGDVIPDVEYLEEIDPILMLWDNHDLPIVKTHGLLFETRVGKGRLLVSALKHTGKTNAAGKWLIDVLLEHLDKGPMPKNGFSAETIQRLRLKLKEKTIDLTKPKWSFKPDEKDVGLKQSWTTIKLDDTWKPIRVGQHWESQGYPNLDGWAWYRHSLAVPANWAGQPLYLNFEGVDDYYEVFINGQKIGGGGNIEKKESAFGVKQSIKLPDTIKAGQEITIAVRVYDWYGAGGIHRPVRLSTVPHAAGPQILR